MFYKPEYRRPLREERKQLSETHIHQASQRVAAQLIYFHPLQDAHNIAYYIPSEGEIDPRLIIERPSFNKKNYFLPVLNNAEKKLLFYSHNFSEKLIVNKLSIPEPSTEGKMAFDWRNLDIMFLPLVGFDKHCNRLGRGGGYYDRTLQGRIEGEKPILIGLAYEFQKIDSIEPKSWDIPLDFVVTENEIYERRRLRPIK